MMLEMPIETPYFVLLSNFQKIQNGTNRGYKRRRSLGVGKVRDSSIYGESEDGLKG